MPAKGSKKRSAPGPSEPSPAKRDRGQPPGLKNEKKSTETPSQQKSKIRLPRRRAERAMAKSSDDDSESESQDQEIPPVVDHQKWGHLLLEVEDNHEIKALQAMQRYWRNTAAKEEARLADVQYPTKETYEAPGQHGCPNPTYNEDWSHADENLFLSQYWRGTMYETAITRQFGTSSDTQRLVAMFKISLHIFGVDPMTFWTLNDDEFKVTGNKFGFVLIVGNAKVKYHSPIWSRSFFDSLSKLMTHPIWARRKDGHEFMLFAVKWAIMCRTDDRRPLSEGDAKLLGFIGCPIAPRPEVPLKRTLERLLKRRYNAGETITTEADLLRCIADNTEAHLANPRSRYYRVTTDDLDAVIKGLDESKTWMSCEAHYELYQKSRSTTHTYPSSTEVAELYRKVFLIIERRRMIDHKRDSDSRPPSEPPLMI